MTSTEDVCGQQYYSCVCTLPPHEPETAHECRRPSATNPERTCLGSWRDREDGTIEVVRFPTGETSEADARARMVEILRADPIATILAAGPPRVRRGGIRFER
jgi:hypothetical protein